MCKVEQFDRELYLEDKIKSCNQEVKSLRDQERRVANAQYCFMKSSFTWNAGKTKCQSFKSYLLEINSEAEQNWLMDKVSTGKWWTGGIKHPQYDEWVWDHSGNDLTYRNWYPNQPNGGKSEECMLSEDGRELQLEKQVQKLTKEINYLKDWTSFMNSEYWLGREEATWNDAQASCKAADSKLVEIESEAEDVFVRALAMKLTGSVWLGGTDFGVEGRWVWESDRSAFLYSAWNTAKEQPNNYFKQNCLRLSHINNLTWYDQNCDITYQYICERIFFPN
ncbi:CD209 antigen-like protein C isoform X1 [Crassostrea angulata]|uniref:CD209 antigen-like protein C isoform X1 n=1 Tax=Magallana angulata TaxID=2784310 RepID=UPI0022B15F29|nr:CD209 antigen-like protein C isoform X1 [Crassostrea angulata]